MRSSQTALVAVAVVCTACGCSGLVRRSDSSGEADASAPGTGSPSGFDSGAESDVGSCSLPASGACNAVALQGPLVVPTISSVANLPSLQGGAIADGTYALTAVTVYEATASEADGSPPSGFPPDQATLVVAAGCIQWNDPQSGTSWSSYPTHDGPLMFEPGCPAFPSWQARYAASTTTLLLSPVSAEGSEVFTFARQ